MTESMVSDDKSAAIGVQTTMPESPVRGAGTELDRERRLRRRARRLGFVVNKRRGFSTYYGPNYWLLDVDRGNPVLHDNGDPRNRVTLDELEAYLDKATEMDEAFDWDKAIFGR